jgi:hypothetical protein
MIMNAMLGLLWLINTTVWQGIYLLVFDSISSACVFAGSFILIVYYFCKFIYDYKNHLHKKYWESMDVTKWS